MLKEYTCIICPNGCEIEVEVEVEENKVTSLEGATCKKGKEYVEQEMFDPQRNLSTTVLVEEGEFWQTSVRLTKAVPKDKIFKVMDEIKKVRLIAPVEVGQVVIGNVLGLNSDVIATKKVRILS